VLINLRASPIVARRLVSYANMHIEGGKVKKKAGGARKRISWAVHWKVLFTSMKHGGRRTEENGRSP
jgi:hypothetical protein